MALKNYIINNKKKSTCIIAAMLLLIVSVFIIMYVKNANAGVFVKDENGDRVQTDDINVLEIVAQKGQQVLGYTVEGQEPITVDKIQSYTGDIDVEDFKDATGFVLDKTDNGDGTFRYKVKYSVLNNTFNENVLGDSMAAGEIKVKAVQANELTLSDIEKANLIFINSNDYNSNLLYYYDQIMMDGEMGIAKGDKGAKYTDAYLSEELRSSVAIKKISRAAGDKNLTMQLTKADFVLAGVAGFYEYNFEAYKSVIESLDRESLNGTDDAGTVEKINGVISTTNSTEREAALAFVRDRAGITIPDENKEQLGIYLLKGGWTGYIEENLEQYCEEIKLHPALSFSSIQDVITNTNGRVAQTSISKLVNYKTNVVVGDSTDDLGLTDEEYDEITDCFVSLLNLTNVKRVLINDYVNALFEETFTFTTPANNSRSFEELKTLINNVNSEKQSEVLKELADAAGDADKTASFVANLYYNFTVADIKDYNEYYADVYAEEIGKITDSNAFKSTETESIGYDITKIEQFIADINSNPLYEEVLNSYDLSWITAMGIYNYAMIDEKGLMYNTELLTNNEIGDFTQDLSEAAITDEEDAVVIDNTNNMYKMLLIMRQLQYPYFRDNIASNIDSDGVYYPDGADANGDFIGTGIKSWYKETFGNDYSNRAKYHEPDVVGQTYSVDGTAGADRNYVYKRIYSYTGEQFFGGKNFVATDLGEITGPVTGVITSNTGYTDGNTGGVESASFDETSNYIFLDVSQNHWKTPYAWFWRDGEEGFWVPLTPHDTQKEQFRVVVPEGVSNVIFTPSSSWSGKTGDIKLPSNYDGITYYLGTGNYPSYSTSGTNKVYFGNLSTSIRTDSSITSPSEDKIVKYNGKIELEFSGYNITNAKYMVDNDGIWRSISVGEKIPLGEDLPEGTLTNIRLKYDTDVADGAEASYWYRKNKDTYSVDISNVLNGSVVEYYGNMNVDINYKKVTDFKYSMNDGEFVSVSSGTSINIGADLTDGTNTKLVFTYVVDGVEKRVITTLSKKSVQYSSEDGNYLSVKTANAAEGLTYDNTLPVSVNNIITKGNKGQIVRYIMDVTLMEITEPLNILEIQPSAETSELNSVNGVRKLVDYLNLDVTINTMADAAKYFKITSMSVKEFNTRNDDLTAVYDLIYIGVDSGYIRLGQFKDSNNKSVHRTQYNDTAMNGLVYTGIGDKYNIAAFLTGVAAEDYTELTTGITNANQTREAGYWKRYFFGGFTNNADLSWNLDPDKNYVLNASKTSYTRLTGNDLTVKKMNALLDYLKAGYPILLADEIMECDSAYYVSADESPQAAERWRYVDVNSKMYNFVIQAKSLGRNSAGLYSGLDESGTPVFLDGKTYPSLVSVSNAKNGKNPENLSDAEKLEGGLSFALKRISRVEFELIETPTQYNKNADGTRLSSVQSGANFAKTGNVIAKSSEEYRKYSFTLGIKSNVDVQTMEDNYEYQIYIDKSGKGTFEEDYTIHLDPSVEYQFTETETGMERKVVITGNWPGSMEGFIPWKIEAYNKNNPELKFSYIGFSAFQNQNESSKRDVYVLWVRTPNASINFKTSLQNYSGKIEDYRIHLVTMSYTEFVNMWSTEGDVEYNADNTLLRVKPVIDYMNSHRYNKSYYYDIDESAVDNSEFNMLVFGFQDSYVGEDINSIQALKNIEYFVDSGHSLLFTHDNASYLTTMNYFTNGSGGAVSIPSNWTFGRYTTAYMRNMLGMDVYGVTTSSSELSEAAANARKYLRDDIKQSDLRAFTDGTIFRYYGNKLYTTSPHSGNLYSISNWMTTYRIMKVNAGQITEYPFILDEMLKVSQTHTQYLQLNMEDTDTIVWYTLDYNGSGSFNNYYKYTKGDGANNYYIYTKGNITYTGSGHSAPGAEEQLLFINTVVAALKAGNFRPEIQFPYAVEKENGIKYVSMYSDEPGVSITFRPIDYDTAEGAADTFTQCRIYIDLNDNGIYDEGTDILLNDTYATNPEGVPDRSAFIKDINNTGYITINAEELVNRGFCSFMITREDIETMKTLYSAQGFTDITDHKIYVEVVDNGTKKDVNAKSTAKNFVMVEEKQSVNLFNLN